MYATLNVWDQSEHFKNYQKNNRNFDHQIQYRLTLDHLV